MDYKKFKSLIASNEKVMNLLKLIVKSCEKGHNLEILSNIDEYIMWEAVEKFGYLNIHNMISYMIVHMLKYKKFDFKEIKTKVEQETINKIILYANQYTDNLIDYLRENYDMEKIANESIRLYL